MATGTVLQALSIVVMIPFALQGDEGSLDLADWVTVVIFVYLAQVVGSLLIVLATAKICWVPDVSKARLAAIFALACFGFTIVVGVLLYRDTHSGTAFPQDDRKQAPSARYRTAATRSQASNTDEFNPLAMMEAFGRTAGLIWLTVFLHALAKRFKEKGLARQIEIYLVPAGLAGILQMISTVGDPSWTLVNFKAGVVVLTLAWFAYLLLKTRRAIQRELDHRGKGLLVAQRFPA